VPETASVAANEQRLEALNLPVILPSADDLLAHEKYLAALDKAVKGACVWRQFEPIHVSEVKA
jgi:DNA polymerase-3 subunit epsilon